MQNPTAGQFDQEQVSPRSECDTERIFEPGLRRRHAGFVLTPPSDKDQPLRRPGGGQRGQDDEHSQQRDPGGSQALGRDRDETWPTALE
jgi:hypothetical protein